MPDTYTEDGVTYTYRESYGNNIGWYYNKNMDRSAAVWYTDDTYSKVRDSITFTGRELPSRTKDIPTVTEDLGYNPDSYPYGFEDICFGKDISLTFSPLQTGPSTGTTPLVGVDSSKGKIEAGNTHVVNGDTVYNALDTEQTARKNADTALSGRIDTIDKKVDSKADANLGNLTDAGKQVIRNTMKPDLAKKADADASNIDVNAFSGKLGIGTITDGDMHLVTGSTVFKAIKDMPAGDILVKRDGDKLTIDKDGTATTVDVSGKDGAARTITGVATDTKDATSAANVGYVNASAQGLHNEIQGVQQSLTDDINKVGAGAAALAGLHPGEYDPADKWDFAAGYGHYKGANAGALGAYYHPNEDTLVSLSSTLGNGDPMLSAGVTFKLGSGVSSHTMSRTTLTKELAAVQQQNQVLAAQNQAIAQQMAAVDQKNQQLEKDIADLKAKLAALAAKA